MTITRVWQSGFELQELLKEITSVTGTVQLSTAQKRTGNYSLEATNGTNRNATILLPSTYAQFRTGFHFRNANPNSTNTPDIICFYSGAATPIIRIRHNAGQIQAVMGASTVLASGTYVPYNTVGNWFHFSVDVNIAASGWVKVYIDGNVIINFTGNTSTAGANIDRIILGQITSGQSWAGSVFYDDIFFDNLAGEVAATFAPDYRYDTILVSGNGDNSAWLGSDLDSTDNFLLVDDVPNDGDTTYVATSSAGNKDLYNMNTITLPAGWSIASVIPLAMAKKDSALSTLGVKMVTKVSGTEQASAALTVGTDYTYIWARQTTKPGGGAWDQTALDNVQVGIESA